MSDVQIGKPGPYGVVRVKMVTLDKEVIEFQLKGVSIVKQDRFITRVTGKSFDIFYDPKSEWR
ncbi:hypothetical protein ACFO25_05495 [Paenactinomyces guangxiensis]|uniref:Uncharacterized protein n=1 Tax=Paenactinomyces guangxiensis TaxID=1490290 RepID=A0A7W2A8X6_9BACL|nr:hypothetical protein [Paenactinomyces guangxiensis]MBA4494313.1 hypothetical protein [Paenactinomyces guangxiensis]MBH8590807.1 hypothetical protein [Paenactinomyces guangxiensis]